MRNFKEHRMFEGSYVAIVTPFLNGNVDEDSFRKLIEFQIENKTDGIVVAGCTGEAATLSHEEQKKLIALCVECVNGRVKVIAGTGSNNTTEAVALTRFASDAGADGALLITPYYNKPTPDGLVQHYSTVAEAAGLPIMLYNVPGRTGTNMNASTISMLSKIDNVVSLKEAGVDLDQISGILAESDISLLSGNDSLTLPIMALGGKGVVSVVGNIAPKKVSEMVRLALQGDFEKARAIHYELLPLANAMFYETNPMCVKKALEIMGMCGGELRLPLVPVKKETATAIESVMELSGLL